MIDSEMTGTMVSRKSAATTAEETDNLVQDASVSQKAAWEEAMRAIIDESGQVANENTDFVVASRVQTPTFAPAAPVFMDETKQQLKRKERMEEEEQEIQERAMESIPHVEPKKPKVRREKNMELIQVELWQWLQNRKVNAEAMADKLSSEMSFLKTELEQTITFNLDKDEVTSRTEIVNSMQAALNRCVHAITEFTAQNITKDVVQRMQNCDDSDDMKRNVTQADPATTTTTGLDHDPTRPRFDPTTT